VPHRSSQRCGFVAIVGKPNVGKSTLLNALVGQKSASPRARRRPRATASPAYRTVGHQFVFVDTPGFQTRHGNALNKSLNKTVLGAVADVDLILFVVEAGRFNLADAKVLVCCPANVPAILLANKFDLVHRRGELAPWLRSMQERHPFAEFVPMSAKNPGMCQRLFAHLRKVPAAAALDARPGRTDRPQRALHGLPRWCARSCSA
jgi:GTPase